MRPIQMVDLKEQYKDIKDQVDAAILEVLDSSAFIGGPQVNSFTQNLASYLNIKHVIPCANGTDALQIAMMALNLQPGDEIITPSFTYIATTEVMALLRLQPIFVDVDRSTFCIDPASIRKAITKKTKAIVPVHLYGHCAQMEEILAIAEEYNLFVIEDNAQALGGDYFFSNGLQKKTGTMSTVGCTSFFPSKNLGCYGDGGALFTDNDELAERIKMTANHGQKHRYYHDIVGCNSRLDAIQAAVLNIKLPLLDKYIDARRKVADIYDEAFAEIPGIMIPYRSKDCKHVFHQYTLILEKADRNQLQGFLAEKNIPSMIYYPVPAHRQKMFEAFGGSNFNLPETDWLTSRVISLPIHTELEQEQQEYIIDNVVKFLNR